MLNVGIIGCGPAWESRYYPAIQRLSDRLRPVAIYHAVPSTGELLATGLKVGYAAGIHSLIARPDIEAILLLDSHWHGFIPLQFACEYRKPVFIAGSLGEDLPRITRLQHWAAEHGIDLMPEFSRRYTPATLRFRELIATSLGRIRRLRVELTLPTVTKAHGESTACFPGQNNELDVLVGLLDWCRWLIGLPPHWISSRLLARTSTTKGMIEQIRAIDMTFNRSATDGEAGRAEIRLHLPGLEVTPPESDMTLYCQADCAHGHATLTGSDRLSWRCGAQQHSEILTTERSDVEQMLDHFTRRALGALLPTPTLEDVCQALAWVQAVSQAPNHEITPSCLIKKT